MKKKKTLQSDTNKCFQGGNLPAQAKSIRLGCLLTG